MQSTKGYGSTQHQQISGAATAEEGLTSPAPHAWESRGTIFGLVIDVFCSSATQFGILITMFLHLRAGDDGLMPCTKEAPWALTQPGTLICEYTKAYVICFPGVSIMLMLLFIGRELLLKRLYYGLLKAGGVLGFRQNLPLTDPLIWVLLWCYVHVLVHFVFLLCAAIETKEAQGTAGQTLQEPVVNKDLIYLLADLIGFIMIPGTLFVVFFYQVYDIEKTLVPLSQYVHDAVEDSFDEDLGHKELAELNVLQDGVARMLLDEESAQALGIHSDSRYEEFIEMYKRERRSHEDMIKKLPSLGHVGLLDAMWPLRFMLAVPSHASQADMGFQSLWLAFCTVVVPVSVWILTFLFIEIRKDIYNVIDGDTKALLAIAVEVAHFILASVLVDKLINPSVRQTWISWTIKASIEACRSRYRRSGNSLPSAAA